MANTALCGNRGPPATTEPPRIAVEALDRVLSEDSEWRDLWGEGGATTFPQVNKLRSVLCGPPGLPGSSHWPDPRAGREWISVAAVNGGVWSVSFS